MFAKLSTKVKNRGSLSGKKNSHRCGEEKEEI